MEVDAYKQPFRLTLGADRVIRGDYYRSAAGSGRGTLVLCHGYKGFKDWGMFPHVAAELAELLDVVAINFSHNGVGDNLLDFTELDKFAQATYSRDLEDLAAVSGAVRSGRLLAAANAASAAGMVVAELDASSSEAGEQDAGAREEREAGTAGAAEATHIAGPAGAAETAGAGAARKLVLLGHSRGGGTSLVYALDHPEQVAGVISWNGITDLDLLTDADKAAMRSAGRSYTANARTKQMMPLDLAILQDLEQHRERYDLPGRIAAIRCPVYLIQGTEDGDRRLSGSALLQQRNPAVQWELVQGGNHTFGAVHPYAGETEELREAIAKTKLALRDILGN
uniref:AB hydrolase-1 domain-containing protein n=2 Tax=Paenibacillus athensensis TaxID=1967502 RepID=A0A4Y8PT43_9BACL